MTTPEASNGYPVHTKDLVKALRQGDQLKLKKTGNISVTGSKPSGGFLNLTGSKTGDIMALVIVAGALTYAVVPDKTLKKIIPWQR